MTMENKTYFHSGLEWVTRIWNLADPKKTGVVRGRTKAFKKGVCLMDEVLKVCTSNA